MYFRFGHFTAGKQAVMTFHCVDLFLRKRADSIALLRFLAVQGNAGFRAVVVDGIGQLGPVILAGRVVGVIDRHMLSVSAFDFHAGALGIVAFAGDHGGAIAGEIGVIFDGWVRRVVLRPLDKVGKRFRGVHAVFEHYIPDLERREKVRITVDHGKAPFCCGWGVNLTISIKQRDVLVQNLCNLVYL